MSAEIVDINDRAIELWEAYMRAKDYAERTGLFEDARHAGLLWGQFLDLYSGNQDERGKVLDFRRKEQ